MSQYTITFPDEGEPGHFPPYQSIVKVLELAAVQEDAVGPDDAVHEITFLTSMAPEVIEIRLQNPSWLRKDMRTLHVVARWENDGFKQYLLWDSSTQDIVDMVEA